MYLLFTVFMSCAGIVKERETLTHVAEVGRCTACCFFSELKYLSNLVLWHFPVFSFVKSQHVKYSKHISHKREVLTMYVLFHLKRGIGGLKWSKIFKQEMVVEPMLRQEDLSLSGPDKDYSQSIGSSGSSCLIIYHCCSAKSFYSPKPVFSQYFHTLSSITLIFTATIYAFVVDFVDIIVVRICCLLSLSLSFFLLLLLKLVFALLLFQLLRSSFILSA